MYAIEVTDTFGGEANYCWVRRGTTKATSKRGIAKAIREVAGWDTSFVPRVNIENFGDGFTVRPSQASGVCQIAFATWTDE